jgi:uncharacterized pyridoxamine 5'-phosphate oxidase family protein
MRFRSLTIDELKELETEFKQFLIINQVYNEEWIEMNQKDLEKANALVDLFSDQVLEKVYGKIDFLEKRDKNAFSVFAITKNDIETITIQSKNQTIELLTNAQIETALNQHLNELEIYCGTKKLAKDKCDEVFDIIKEGCSITTFDVWHSFSSFLDQIKKK